MKKVKYGNIKEKEIKIKENPKEKAAKELTPEMVAQGLRKWLMDDKKK